MKTDDFITCRQAAEILGTSQSYLSRCRARKASFGTIRYFVNAAGDVRYMRADVDAYVAAHARAVDDWREVRPAPSAVIARRSRAARTVRHA